MSWDSYCENLMLSKLESASVFGHDGTRWAAKGPDYPTDAELKELAQRRTLPIGHEKLVTSFTYGGVKYMFIRKDEDGMKGKLVTSSGGTGTGGGITIAYGKQTILAATFQTSVIQDGDANVAVSKLCDYLKETGY